MKLTDGTTVLAERRIAMVAMAGLVCLGLWMVFTVSPAALPFPGCVFHSLTGHSCLTCGMTRSLNAISHGELIASIRYHLFGPVVFIGMLLAFAGFSLEAIRGKKVILQLRWEIWRLVLGGAAIAWLIYWVVRLITE